jgi:hypothetical protein
MKKVNPAPAKQIRNSSEGVQGNAAETDRAGDRDAFALGLSDSGHSSPLADGSLAPGDTIALQAQQVLFASSGTSGAALVSKLRGRGVGT